MGWRRGKLISHTHSSKVLIEFPDHDISDEDISVNPNLTTLYTILFLLLLLAVEKFVISHALYVYMLYNCSSANYAI